MATIPQQVTDPIAHAIYEHYKGTYGKDKQRPYLGASSIGKSCSRALWYGFRWAKAPEFSGRMFRLFQSGHLQEPRVVKDLRGIGCQVYEVDPQTGRQWSYSEESLGHHFAGNMDGQVKGVPGAPRTTHVLEIKTSSEKSFRTMQKQGVKEAKPEHFAQMQIYMHWSKLDRALYIMVNKDNDEIYTERVEYDKAFALGLITKAKAIIESPTPPAKISSDDTWFECRFCDYHSLCFSEAAPAVNCRTCAHSTPSMDGHGAWTCGRYGGAEIPQEGQREGCDGHRYIPILLENFARPVDTAEDGDAVVYETKNGGRFINGDPDDFGQYISSKEIHSVADKSSLTDVRVIELRNQLNDQFPGARLVG